jgi:hypothetical protein
METQIVKVLMLGHAYDVTLDLEKKRWRIPF